MTRKKKEFVNIMRHSVVGILIKIVGAGCLTGFFATLVVVLIEGYAEEAKAGLFFDTYTFFITLVLTFFAGIGIFIFSLGIKDIYDWIMYAITKKKGIDKMGKINGFQSMEKDGHTTAGHHFRGTIYYSINFEYEIDGEKKVGKTDYIYLKEECNYLLTLSQVKIKVYKNNIVVNERFRRELYHV